MVKTIGEAHVSGSNGERASGDEGDGAPLRLAVGERWWECRSCKGRLGICDETGEVRFRYKDFFVRLATGPGGYVAVNCRRCGRENLARDVEPDRPIVSEAPRLVRSAGG